LCWKMFPKGLVIMLSTAMAARGLAGLLEFRLLFLRAQQFRVCFL